MVKFMFNFYIKLQNKINKKNNLIILKENVYKNKKSF